MKICYAYRGDNSAEEYTAHIERALRTWSHIKKYYAGGVERAFPNAGKADLVQFAILTHDLGKLASHYQQGRPGSYRHEVVSAYFAYRYGPGALTEEERAALAAAVMLHHEPIILSAYVTRLGESYLPIYVVRKALEEADLTYGCGDDVIQYYAAKDKRLAEALERWRDRGLDRSEVLAAVKKIVVATSVGEPTRLHVMRTKTAAILHPLVVSDSVAAHIWRQPGRGTAVSRQALTGAEPIDEAALKTEP